jgi:excisionase family DNA binding protein
MPSKVQRNRGTSPAVTPLKPRQAPHIGKRQSEVGHSRDQRGADTPVQAAAVLSPPLPRRSPPPEHRSVDDTFGVTRKLSVVEAADYLGVSKSTLDKLRVSGGGPAYLQLGRRVVYDPGDLEAWVASKRRASTSRPISVRRARDV